jgi:hypothetical protein
MPSKVFKFAAKGLSVYNFYEDKKKSAKPDMQANTQSQSANSSPTDD